MQPRHRQQALVALTFAAGVAGLPLAARQPDRPSSDGPFEWGQFALATYALSRIVAREKVGDFIREPIKEAAASTPEQSWADVAGELVTCTRCVGVWSATAMIYLRAFAPRQSTVLVGILSLVGANNFLQAAFSHLTDASDGGRTG